MVLAFEGREVLPLRCAFPLEIVFPGFSSLPPLGFPSIKKLFGSSNS
ncbi:hypothetical protein Tco_0430521, partial [Tanacetum coccineum]